jgi:hypothetical protein
MAEPFQSTKNSAKDAEDVAARSTKIREAQERLIIALNKSQFDIVTIIPFHSVVEAELTASLKTQKSVIDKFIRRQRADGETNLGAALSVAIKIGTVKAQEAQFSYVRYLIVTDGLSGTIDQDIELVKLIPQNQGVDGILIDQTKEGEEHLRRLCVRGTFSSVSGAQQLTEALNERAKTSAARIPLANRLEGIAGKSYTLSVKLTESAKQLEKNPTLSHSLQPLIQKTLDSARKSEAAQQKLSNQLARPDADLSYFANKLSALDNQQKKIEKTLELLRKFEEFVPRFDISISHPPLLSKGYSSPFVVLIYPDSKRGDAETVLTQINRQFQKAGLKETIHKSDLVAGLTVIVKLSSSDIEFSDEIAKQLNDKVARMSYYAKPKDSCHQGLQTVILSVTDKDKGTQYESIVFEIKIMDYAFDHMPRPIVNAITSGVLALSSVATFIFTHFGQIEKTFGIASGSVTAAVAGVIITRAWRLFSRQSVLHP